MTTVTKVNRGHCKWRSRALSWKSPNGFRTLERSVNCDTGAVDQHLDLRTHRLVVRGTVAQKAREKRCPDCTPVGSRLSLRRPLSLRGSTRGLRDLRKRSHRILQARCSRLSESYCFGFSHGWGSHSPCWSLLHRLPMLPEVPTSEASNRQEAKPTAYGG